MATISYIQEQFTNMNREVDPSLLGKTEYPLLINGRVREGVVKPINKSVELPVTSGKCQGVCGAGNYLLVFIDGKAYVKDFSFPDSAFVNLVDFQLDATVEYIFATLVPESYTNYKRVHVSDDSASQGVNLTSIVGGSRSAAVCQDGKNQPQLIYSDGGFAEAKTYGQWTTDNREYVPKGTQMVYSSGVLYLASVDGKRLYRSVSGRPLDFMIPIDSAGNKLPEESGKADAIAHTVSFDPITNISQINDTEQGIFISTLKSSYLVRPSSASIFGEPLLRNQFLFPTGALNQFCTVDILGDTALIDTNGIKTFNSIQQSQSEGKNSNFSRKINGLFEGIVQDVACAFLHDNYALFAVNTIFGYGVLVYDTITQAFISLDLPDIEGHIKQFAEIKINGSRRLFFITTANKLYEAYASTTVESCRIYIGEFCTRDPKIEQKPADIKLVLINAIEAGTIYATPYYDGQASTTRVQHVTEVGDSLVPSKSADSVRSLLFSFPDSLQCWKFGIFIEWAFNAQLSFCRMDADACKVANSVEQSATQYAQAANLQQLKSFTPTSTVPTGVVILNGVNLNQVTAVYLDDHEVPSFNRTSSTLITFVVPAGLTGQFVIRLKSNLGFAFSSGKLTVV